MSPSPRASNPGLSPAQGIAGAGDANPRGNDTLADAHSRDFRPGSTGASANLPSRRRLVEVPLDLVVACGPEGVVIHPGGYRLSPGALRRAGTLKQDLKTIVENYERIDPEVRPRPSVQFLIEPGGSDTYWEARRQTVLAGLQWPVTIRIAGSQTPTVFPRERF
ncbi:MAG: hypothetical protein NVSMB9_31190 [Isosphaeraceae bacterium]